MATSVACEIFGNEELLFSGVVTGTLEQYKQQLNSLGDVDVRGVKQRTLLYVAVGLGKVDWVEGLLEKGANPGLRDVEGVSVVELAQGLAEKYPENEDRQSISKLVRLVMKVRDSVGQGGCNATSTGQDAGMEAMGQDVKSGLSREVASMCESIIDIHSRIAAIDTLRQEITTIRDLINDVKNEMATINTHAMQEMSSIRKLINEEITTNRDLINDVKTEMATIRKSIDDVKTEIAARDVLLSALENSVTSTANRERPVGMTPESSTVPEEVLPSAPRTEEKITPERTGEEPEPSTTTETSTVPEKVAQSTPRTEEEIRRECVKEMMRKTRILESDEGKVTKARGLYEKLYSEWDETACLFKFLKSHDDVSVVIDFDSRTMGGMKWSFTDHDGVERDASGYFYFADFEEKKIYLGGGNGDDNETIAYLAGALAQMSVCLAFNNGGRPYAKGDDVTERRMKNALKEVEEEYRRIGGGLEWFIYIAVRKETRRGKEVYLTSAVPSIIARYGSTEGTSLLQRQIPLLLELFRDSVMPTLLAKAQV